MLDGRFGLCVWAAVALLTTTLGASAAGAVTLGDVSEAEIQNAKPGEIIRVWPQVGGAPQNAKAYRILYRSTGIKGEPIPVTGAIFIPQGDAPRGAAPSLPGPIPRRAW